MSTQDILEIEGLVRPEHVTITSTSAKIVAPGPATGITCNEATTPLPKAASTNVGFEIVASPRGDTGEDSGEDSGVEPEPFFTSSGTQELIAMAMLRSRRTARQEERARKQALHHSRIAAPETAPLSPISSNPVRRHVRGDPMAADFKAANATVSRTVNKTGHDGKTTKANTIPKNDGADTQHAREDEYEWGDINDEDWDSVLAQCQSATNIL
jgi:hypothetical protein